MMDLRQEDYFFLIIVLVFLLGLMIGLFVGTEHGRK
jgi:uncharacterized protein YneF (UPF0154 family)